MVLCSFGAVVNVAFAKQVFNKTELWSLAGLGGAAAGAILNYSLDLAVHLETAGDLNLRHTSSPSSSGGSLASPSLRILS